MTLAWSTNPTLALTYTLEEDQTKVRRYSRIVQRELIGADTTMILASPQEFTDAYTEYRWHEGYARRARLLTPLPEPVLVVGCGFGFLVAELERLNKRAWGVDASDYCWDNRITARFTQHDILRGPPPLTVATVVTEDLLPWLTDDEAVTCAENCAQISPLVLHLVTESGQADYNYHSTGYWMTLLNQLTVSLEGM